MDNNSGYDSIEELIKQLLVELHRIDNAGEEPEAEEDTEEWSEIIKNELGEQTVEYMLESGYSAALLADMLDKAFILCQYNDVDFEDAFLAVFEQRLRYDGIAVGEIYYSNPFFDMKDAMYKIHVDECEGDELRSRQKLLAEIFWEHWNAGVRDWMKELGKHGTVTLEDIDELYDFSIDSCLNEADIALLNSGMNDERISVFEDILSAFNWNDDPEGEEELRSRIGESLERQGKIEECDAYFKRLLLDRPDSLIYANMYILCLNERGAYEEAKKLLEKYMSSDMVLNHENYLMFARAEEIYEALGENDKAELCHMKLREYDTRPATISPMNSSAAKQLRDNPDYIRDLGLPIDVKLDMEATETRIPVWAVHNGNIVANGERSIYPSDPCPCGSGKKYSRCCGKNNI